MSKSTFYTIRHGKINYTEKDLYLIYEGVADDEKVEM